MHELQVVPWLLSLVSDQHFLADLLPHAGERSLSIRSQGFGWACPFACLLGLVRCAVLCFGVLSSRGFLLWLARTLLLAWSCALAVWCHARALRSRVRVLWLRDRLRRLHPAALSSYSLFSGDRWLLMFSLRPFLVVPFVAAVTIIRSLLMSPACPLIDACVCPCSDDHPLSADVSCLSLHLVVTIIRSLLSPLCLILSHVHPLAADVSCLSLPRVQSSSARC